MTPCSPTHSCFRLHPTAEGAYGKDEDLTFVVVVRESNDRGGYYQMGTIVNIYGIRSEYVHVLQWLPVATVGCVVHGHGPQKTITWILAGTSYMHNHKPCDQTIRRNCNLEH